jgi:hypothetical protein
MNSLSHFKPFEQMQVTDSLAELERLTNHTISFTSKDLTMNQISEADSIKQFRETLGSNAVPFPGMDQAEADAMYARTRWTDRLSECGDGTLSFDEFAEAAKAFGIVSEAPLPEPSLKTTFGEQRFSKHLVRTFLVNNFSGNPESITEVAAGHFAT